jgi:flagellin
MVTINTNYAASFAANAAKQTSVDLDRAMEKLSTGKRINYARDDAAGQAIASRLTAEIQGLATASRNASDGQAMIDTAEGALQETHSILMRLRELAVQSSNGTLTTADRGSLQAEAAQLEEEISRISDTTSWGGLNLLNGNLNGGITFQAGTKEGGANLIAISIPDMAATAATIAISAGFTMGSFTNAQSYITAVDAAIAGVSDVRGKLGAVSNRLNSTIANMDQVRVNLASSRGRIEDTDFATETGNLARAQILQQAATAMLAQANASQASVLTLLNLKTYKAQRELVNTH